MNKRGGKIEATKQKKNVTKLTIVVIVQEDGVFDGGVGKESPVRSRVRPPVTGAVTAVRAAIDCRTRPVTVQN